MSIFNSWISEEASDYATYYKDIVDFCGEPKYYLEYLEYIFRHKGLVCTAWKYICDTLCELGFINEKDIDNINSLIITHDDSKLKRDEFYPYAKRFYGPCKNNKYVKIHFKEAVALHKSRNLHHYENLKSYKGKDWKNYAVELICDYIAMGWEFNNYICEYFDKVKDELKNELPDEYYAYIESIIKVVQKKFELAEKPIDDDTIGWISYMYNYQNDPFENYDGSDDVILYCIPMEVYHK